MATKRLAVELVGNGTFSTERIVSFADADGVRHELIVDQSLLNDKDQLKVSTVQDMGAAVLIDLPVEGVLCGRRVYVKSSTLR